MSYKMNQLFVWISILGVVFFLTSCCDSDKNFHPLTYYMRSEGDNNGYTTYNDYVAIDNYRDGILTIRQFDSLARLYVDTVNSRQPISHVSFLGKRPCGSLPAAKWDNWDNQRKYVIVTIGFDNTFKENKDKKEKQTTYISFKGKIDKTYTQPSQIDSLLMSKTMLVTGF